MKFILSTATLVATILVSLVSAQSDPAACTLCLQEALQTLPACGNVEATPGSVSQDYANCLCSSLNGAWMDSCKGDAQCGSTLAPFQSLYASNIQLAGLNCAGGQASFTPPSA
ncbi:hypothetical protein BG011_007238 [Mortierella polycephala]|uniref:Extracellular membrane protein CFEM domain-containing protein n=1 Tax=Mortierella polycephala TaxID=41804 RepID=A0A9P6QAQ7_9FUNG|nr:hypothetical protein BG011_007238 [Mortierella polycephala]